MVRNILVASLILALAGQMVFGYHMVCYYENWAQYRPGNNRMMPSDIDPQLCTHVLYAFAKVDNHELAPYEWNDATLYSETMQLKKINPDLKVLLAVGGWNHGTATFTAMAATKQNRQHFITTTIAYLRQYGFDGLDLDWEYPGDRGSPLSDKEKFALLCEELMAAFEAEALSTGRARLLLTAAVPASDTKVSNGYDVPRLANALDFVNLMSYDLHGPWSSLTGHNAPMHGSEYTVDKAATVWKNNGMPKDKIVIGLPTYGYSWRVQSTGSQIPAPGIAGSPIAGPVFYRDICSDAERLDNTVTDPVAKVPYTYSNNIWISYDNKQSFTKKCNYIKSSGFGGGMIWALGMDDHNGLSCRGGKYPLLSTLSSCLGVTDPSSTTPDSNTPTDPTPTPTTPTPKPDTCVPESVTCPPSGDAYFPNTCDCNKFYRCAFGTPFSTKCPPGLLWNQDIQLCDWPQNVNCTDDMNKL